MSSLIWTRNSVVTYPLGLALGLFLFVKYHSRTMIPARIYAETLALIAMILRNPDLKAGAIIECGTWRGGMSAGMIEVAGIHRTYHFFDSFEGLPPAGERDGEGAKDYQRNVSAPGYHNNCTASYDEFESTLSMTGYPTNDIGIHRGWFNTTVPDFVCPPIAVLRLDVDWYESTMICLEKFWDWVLPGGLVLIDDYYSWEGCSKAVHAFLAKRDATEQVHQGLIGRVPFIIKHASVQRVATLWSDGGRG